MFIYTHKYAYLAIYHLYTYIYGITKPRTTSSSRDTTARDEVTLLVSTTGVVNLALGVHVVEVLHITERRASVEIPSLSIKSGTYSPPQVDRKFDIWGSC